LILKARWRQLNESREASLHHLVINYIVSNIFSLYLTEFNFGRMGHCIVHNNRTADMPSALSVFSAHQMPAAGAMALYLAGSGNLDSFAQSLMGLLFRHLTISFDRIYSKIMHRK
jgi:hypothetical protein